MKTRLRAAWVSLTPEKECGKLEKGGSMPGIALATCGDLHTQRPSPRQDTESQKANPFIPEAQAAVLLKNSRHLLGSLRLFSSGGPPIPDCSACLLAMPHFTFKSIPGADNPRPFPHWQGTPVPEVKEQEQGGHPYFPGKSAPRPPPLPKAWRTVNRPHS